MKRNVLILFGMFFLLLFGCGKKAIQEAVLPLTEEQISRAVDYGIKNASLSVTEFTRDWTVDLGYDQGKGTATIITPFLKVALLSRQAALSGEKPDERVIRTAIKEDTDFINFDLLLFGGSPKFPRTVEFHLKYAGREIKPSYCFMPSYGEIARDYTMSAKCRVKFSRAGIPPDAKIVLVASFKPDEETKEVSVAEFQFDLKKYL